MTEEKIIKHAVEDKNTLEVSANYVFTGKCTTCKKYFERDGKHHCASMNPFAASHKSANNNFEELESCTAYKKASVANEGKFHHALILFVITIGVVIYGLVTRPFEMIQKYWFYGVLGVVLTVSFFIRSLFMGNTLTSETFTNKQQKLDKLINRIMAFAIFAGYFLYHNGLKSFSNGFFTPLAIWGALFFVLTFGIKILSVLFEFNNAVYKKGGIISTVVITFIAIIAFAIIFGLIDFVLGVLLMTTGPQVGATDAKSSSAGVISE